LVLVVEWATEDTKYNKKVLLEKENHMLTLVGGMITD